MPLSQSPAIEHSMRRQFYGGPDLHNPHQTGRHRFSHNDLACELRWGDDRAPTLTTTASKVDMITLFCTSSTPTFEAYLSGKGFGS